MWVPAPFSQMGEDSLSLHGYQCLAHRWRKTHCPYMDISASLQGCGYQRLSHRLGRTHCPYLGITASLVDEVIGFWAFIVVEPEIRFLPFTPKLCCLSLCPNSFYPQMLWLLKTDLCILFFLVIYRKLKGINLCFL